MLLLASSCAGKEPAECPAGEHAPDIVTYTLVGGEYVLYNSDDGDDRTIVLEVANDELPAVTPYFVNADDGFHQHGLLNTSKFLQTWADFEEGFEDIQNRYGEGSEKLKYAGAAVALGAQCRSDASAQSMSFSFSYSNIFPTSFSSSADILYIDFADVDPMSRPNALLLTAPDPSNGHLVHINRIERNKASTRFHMQLGEVNPKIVPEGSCHPRQSSIAEHFHHSAACGLVNIANDLVLPLGMDEALKFSSQEDRIGFTLNIKLAVTAFVGFYVGGAALIAVIGGCIEKC